MAFESIIDTTLIRRRERDQGVMSLFADTAPEMGGFDERLRSATPSSTRPSG
jgi:hypothetical protein